MAKHKIVLYNPNAVFYTLPLALVAIGSALDPEAYEVQIIDGRLHEDALNLVLAATEGALCFGVTVLTGSPIRDALRVSEAVKLRHPELPIIWGGWHPSLFPRDVLEHKAIDITVQGQGEETFRELVDRLAAQETLADLPGITYREAGKINQNIPRPLRDMNLFPGLNYDLIPVENYFRLKGERQLDYISSTGCHFRCSFCADPFVYERQWTGIQADRIGDELEYLWRRYRFDDLSFQDETFFTYRKRVVEIAEEILQRGLHFSWAGTLRADQGLRLSEPELALCVKSGLRRVMIGVESGSVEMLKWMKKDITIEQVILAAEKVRRHGLGAIFPFIVGFPDESEESVWDTLRLVKKIRAMSPRFETPIFYFKTYPGSEITRELVKQGYQLPGSLEEWADFDYVGSPPGPWVSDRKHQFIETFKFYNRFAWGPETWHRRLIQVLARWRCQRDYYQFPFEKRIIERFKPSPQLS